MKTCKKGLHQYSDELERCPECKKIWFDTIELRAIGKIKTCKWGHQYPDNKKNCSECKKEYRARPEAKAAHKEYQQRSEVKAKAKAYRQTPEAKEKLKINRQKPQAKAVKKAWENKSENKEKIKVSQKNHYKTQKFKDTRKAYLQTPEGKAKQKKSNTKCDKSIGRKIKKRLWLQTTSGKISVKNAKKKYRQSTKGKSNIKVYEQKPDVRKKRLVTKINNSGKRTKIAAQGNLTAKQILERLDEFDNKCAYCCIQLLIAKDNVKQTHPQYQNIDHIVSLLDKNGNPQGQHTKVNIVIACYSCNVSKSNRDVFVFLKEKNITPSKKLLRILKKAIKLHQKSEQEENPIVEVLEIIETKKENK